ncbi:MAG TPA: alpha/beta fold hydrolase [Nocardioidaceae bacterium]|nr:alpha/beta fold hydrolase [Nocardioidaceae bacterium]
MPTSTYTTVPTPDGRDLEVLLAGPEDGLVLVDHHGTPGAAVPYPPFEEAAAERGLRVVALSRPGYSGSTPRGDGPGTVADDVADVVTVLDRLGADRFVTLGGSGGGPRSLGCAALLPDRCLAAVCGAGLAPPEEFDGDVRTGMGEENVAEFTAAMEGAGPLTRLLEDYAPGLFSVTGKEVADSLGSLAPPVDRAALTGELAEAIAAGFRAAGREGPVGWLHDDLALLRPWGFSLRDITVPVAVWQGTEDTMVPFAHGEWLAARVPGARPHLEDGQGHLSLLAGMPRILDDLLDLAGPA